ncbi:TIGR03619 family F420-dependent LLM class oxidoreductase [Streptomyces sp. ODS28]|uniref:TIGR03619 family F420-dependent LLM class oxidoreductase n=1 Tax=Streptomyces sp. ODS28 TaxID=3136688 RepID=UPI0031ED5F90
MRISVTSLLTDETIGPVQLARELEARSFHGLYLPEHTHIPTTRETPAPMGEPLAREYGRTLDPFTALASAAAVTRHLALGTSVALIAQHDPIALAKQIATLDLISEGRFTLGAGVGWNAEEAADHGVTGDAWRRRRTLVRDRIALMRALWSPEPTAYEGEFGSVRASEAHPKPQRPGGPRLLLGGAPGPRMFAHVAEYADGWMPVGGSGLGKAVTELNEAWDRAGRGPERPAVVPAFVQPSPGKLAHFAELGVEEVLLQVPSGDTAHTLRTLDEYSRYL